MQDDLKEKDEFIIMFKIVLDKIASAARNLLNPPPPPNRSDDLCPFFCLLSFLYIWPARSSLGLIPPRVKEQCAEVYNPFLFFEKRYMCP